MKILLLILIMLIPIVHYDDEDGHREPWAEWREASCISESVITMDSSGNEPPCNINTGLGVTVWVCNDGSGNVYPQSYYTTHWYCGVIGEAISIQTVFLPVVMR